MRDRSVTFHLRSTSPDATCAIGRRLGEAAGAGDVFALDGPLGAGKTVLAQGILRGLGVGGYLPSPTFTLIREYRGRVSCYHVDLYRLESPEDVATIGMEECFDGGVVVIEWAGRVAHLLPADHLAITLRASGEDVREIDMIAAGPRSRRLVEVLLRS
ncbi:MAG: tRNA (adenosine(37)-N6)-threonylcarbamoyltransferase complex ATPase subunit type 1 TsaE [Armatimonadetes bacterium]|nr:tRNA (adenosine(37)-N6)-threonylcarbamoyltransferase complex ATPase subunit type 1 TsaE [Armatimonadota bacterium]